MPSFAATHTHLCGNSINLPVDVLVGYKERLIEVASPSASAIYGQQNKLMTNVTMIHTEQVQNVHMVFCDADNS